MTVMAYMLLAAAVVFGVLGAVNQEWLRERFPGGRGPSAGASSGWRRVLFLVIAVVAAYQGYKGLRLVDETSWSADELRQSVRQAAAALEEETHLDDPYEDYSSLIRDEVVEAGEGLGPAFRVDVEAVGRSSYHVTATGAGDGYCMHLSQSEDEEGGFMVPGAGDQGPTRVPEYTLSARVGQGAC
ncbi:hypothetical protein ACIRF8_02755 [Streptomyces sp. NPDC102406]|uniref:hypothetical protein n=1 Tax=Streptomyces sp. NPDC102406 TaxID=3366171 RepID=UPI00382EF99C